MASEWFYTRDGKSKSGPVSSAQLQALAKSGSLQPTDKVWKEGMAKWVPASTIKGLFNLAAAAVTAKKPVPPTASDAKKGRSDARPANDKNRTSKASDEEPEQQGGRGKAVFALVAMVAVACIAGLAVLGVLLLKPDLLETGFGGNKGKPAEGQVAEGNTGVAKKEAPEEQPQDKVEAKKETSIEELPKDEGLVPQLSSRPA